MAPAGFAAVYDRLNQTQNPYEAAIPADVPQYNVEPDPALAPQPVSQPTQEATRSGPAFRTADGVALLLGLLASGGGQNTAPLIAGFLGAKNQFAKNKQAEEAMRHQQEIERQRQMMEQAQRTFANDLAAKRQKATEGYQNALIDQGKGNADLRATELKIKQELLDLGKTESERKLAQSLIDGFSAAFTAAQKRDADYLEAINRRVTAFKDSPPAARMRAIIEVRRQFGKPVDTPEAIKEIASMASQTASYGKNVASAGNLNARTKEIELLTPLKARDFESKITKRAGDLKIALMNAQTNRSQANTAAVRAKTDQLRQQAYSANIDSLVNYRDNTLPLAMRKSLLGGLIQQRIALGQIGNGLMFQIQVAQTKIDEASKLLEKNANDEMAKTALAKQTDELLRLNGELETNKQLQKDMLDNFGVNPDVTYDASGMPNDQFSRDLQGQLDGMLGQTSTSGITGQGNASGNEFPNPYASSGVSPGSGLIPFRPPAPPTKPKKKTTAPTAPTKPKKSGNATPGLDPARYKIIPQI
jgi:hypothetical protein